jgi:hypothetical protein
MQGLIDAAVVVVTMIIPTLNPQSFKKIFHRSINDLYSGGALQDIIKEINKLSNYKRR